ncbi:MAG: hypothetical protein DWQ34_06390 [Planctomycetota bacterium]|nr:MAG: hypothetical protein DWQ29_22395 [Planctomycetota bacterium]REJ95330.1 MAG: hypothetical protein DWQ34_06390 [Planctomycetota bacterium]REK24228.1 MAG: hypothetical protein DWQ41_14430 [Planctomycetota bacterium]REK28786.1 MAG: hypothetical protein DWQ45_24085 [Planctomycetota bacterium]
MSTAIESAAGSRAVTRPGWLRSKSFDLNFIAVASGVAVLTGLAALIDDAVFKVLLFLDLWLLGYHHVISTFTRLVFDWKSFREHRFLIVELPLIITAATLAGVLICGQWILATVYLYWQWFHYTRQSYGIERAYRRNADENATINDYVTTRALSLVPIFGIVFRSWQRQDRYLGMEIRYLPVPEVVVWIVGVMAAAAVGWWLLQCGRAAWQGRLAKAHFGYLLSHHAVFLIGYVLIPDITSGWLVLNVWHNIQYIMFVWYFNNRRFKEQVDPDAKLLSTLSQSKHVFSYILLCVTASTGIYLLVHQTTTSYMDNSLIPAAVTAMMVINFHHYVVDGMIWKRRKPAAAA